MNLAPNETTYSKEEEHLLSFLRVQVGPPCKLMSPSEAVCIDLGIKRQSKVV